MMSVQPSPVVITKRVRNALEKFSKFNLLVRTLFLYTSANKYTPSTEYKYRSNINNPPTFAKAGKVTTTVLNTIFKLLAFFTNLNTLPTLNVLTTLVAPFKLSLLFLEMKMLENESATIMKSNTFHPLLK
jgi:hypothetical protein